MAAKLKVFTWSNGLRTFTVATTSRPKALDAWGADQDLFATGLAHEAEDGPDREAALAAPGAVISRKLEVKVAPAPKAKGRPSKAKARAKVKALEDQLSTLDTELADALHAIDAREASLAVERETLQAHHDDKRSALLARLKTAREAL